MKKRIIATVLTIALALSVVLSLASCGTKVEEFTGNYTYNDAVVKMSSNWNPHTYQTQDERYPIDYITTGLYGFIFNDEIHEVEGKDPYKGYVIIPEMAADMPVDVTEEIKKDHPEFNIPASATTGYAYKIKLNKDAKWENGEKINADTYVYSMMQLLDPDLKNYRATDYIDSSFSIANAENYRYQGQSKFLDNAANNKYAFSSLVKGADGVYTAPGGNKMYIGLDVKLSHLGGDTLMTYVKAYGDQCFDMDAWNSLLALAGDDDKVALTDETYTLLTTLITSKEAWGETDGSTLPNYMLEEKSYADNYDFKNVGLFKSGEYEITIVLGKSLAGFNLLYSLTGNWIVYEDLYEANKKQVEGTDAWTSTYNTSKETTMSYGPYKMTSFERDKTMVFERNENWYGYDDDEHVYKDPTDGKVYPMYQTTKINCQVVSEANTRKLMFLKGQLMGYGLQQDDYDEYRNSDYCYATPSETIFFFIFNGHKDAIADRENEAGFDKTKNDLETMTLQSFRKAVAVTFDKEALCTAISPSRSGGYGLIGDNYIYDPETGAKYRDTEQAKKALCEFYSVDVSKFESLDAAVDSITGYDVETARKLYTQAYNEAIQNGFITDTNNDGKSDQMIEIIYAVQESTTFITKTLDYLNSKMAEVLVGTPFEGKIKFKESAPVGDDWSDKLKAGLMDTCLAGWSGSALDPFGLSDLYTNPAYQYDAAWFDASTVEGTLNVNVAKIGETENKQEVTMSLKQWSDALNGTTVTVNGVEYNFGDGIADVNTRLDILAMIEGKVLQTYNYIPMLQDGSMALLSKQVYYVIEEYNPIMGRGGIAYLKYNYDDAAWAEYVASQGGELKY